MGTDTESDTPTLLLVGGARAVSLSVGMVGDALAQAAAHGLATHVTGPAAALAATPTVIDAADAVSAVEFADPAATRAWAARQAWRGRGFDLVFALQEMAQVAVAEAAEELGVAGNPPDAVRRIRTKDLCRNALAEAGFVQPRVRLCTDTDEALAFAAEFAGPWVIKPRDAMGSIGVSLVRDAALLAEAVGELPEPDRFLIEQFVSGPEFSVEGVFLDGEPRVFAVTAKDKAEPPYFVEIGHTLPAGLSETDEARVRETVTSALRTLGLRVGAFHVELWLTDEAVVLGEVHGRYGGDWIHRMLEYAFPGLELYGTVFQDMLGRYQGPKEFVAQRGAAVRYLTPPPGRLVRIEGWDEVAAHPAVIYSELSARPGATLGPLRKSSDRAGLLVVGAQDSAAAEKLARELVEAVRFTVEPDAPDTD
ncbi:ATP-grasp domain-containing protein [Actinospica durhamensis]|uniref:ATP-grasp domain-containing protein n=1 Tax=Actinospica durhamensis TaxID=1508375 RepID=A0A941EK63_9ACTN|nr:ATP-grasp domain-containing protein [Actinospica durhamensis]MBR7832861.1 ATP-grasp domain-containing protein [Actinospica durhamensis]